MGSVQRLALSHEDCIDTAKAAFSFYDPATLNIENKINCLVTWSQLK